VAQVLPQHGSIRILILSDEVNPHNLSDIELTQPGDLSNALNNASALNTSLITEIGTNQIEQVTAELLRLTSDPMFYDILIYFSHRIPDNGNNAQDRQEAFVSAVETFLQNGGGVISFHHGIYTHSGKVTMLNLLGAQASGSVPYDTVNGQDVIYVGSDHFIGSHQLNYDLTIAYENTSHSIPAAVYPAFNNTPDERYPQMDFSESNSACEIKTLFESDYTNNGSNHLLSYTKYCPQWKSQVFVYQPGEYQPNALSGNNFQILLNAIYFLSDFHWDVLYANGFE
jgi:hypothetical protein